MPVGYIFLDDVFYIPTKADSKKVRNLQTSSKASILIDEDAKDRGIMIECSASILKGTSAKPFKQYMTNLKAWKNNNQTVIIKLVPVRKVSWFA